VGKGTEDVLSLVEFVGNGFADGENNDEDRLLPQDERSLLNWQRGHIGVVACNKVKG
jgi:hypothetical protein